MSLGSGHSSYGAFLIGLTLPTFVTPSASTTYAGLADRPGFPDRPRPPRPPRLPDLPGLPDFPDLPDRPDFPTSPTAAATWTAPTSWMGRANGEN